MLQYQKQVLDLTLKLFEFLAESWPRIQTFRRHVTFSKVNF